MLKIILFIAVLTQVCGTYKILVVFPMPGESHAFLGAGIAKHLMEAGHEVTFITRYPNTINKNDLLREIDISSLQNFLHGNEDMVNIENRMKNVNKFDPKGIISLMEHFVKTHASLFEHENVKKLFDETKEQFDVVIAEWMFDELMSGIAAIFDCPLIWVSTVDPHWTLLRLIDEIPNPAYNGDAISKAVVPFTFTQRLQELLKVVLGLSLQHFYIARLEHKEYNNLIVPMIQKRGHKIPDYEELRYNASLILGNSHVSLGHSIRLPQNYKAIGGYHIDTNVKPLPENLKKLLDNSQNGLIYFSMGTNLRSKHWPATIKENLLKVFGNLKQTVIWKFEEDLPNRPSNVHIVRWAPQQSILAHPNCILFITHGGLLSTTEATHFGKPIIGIPVFGDQFTNVDRAVNRGFAKKVDLSYNVADDLGEAINDILADQRYGAKAKELSLIYHDRPVPPSKELVHWVEHVVRTRGAPHLRSPALLVPWYQKLYLDLVVVMFVVIYAFKMIFTKVKRMLKNKIEKVKKN